MESLNPQIAFETRRAQAILYKNLRDEDNIFHMSLKNFTENFRLSPQLAIELIEELEQINDVIVDPRAIPFYLKCLVELNFYGTGCYQHNIKSLGHMSQSSICKSIKEISYLLNLKMSKYVLFPRTDKERCEIARAFSEEGLPGVIGLIDGTQIPITGVKKDIEMAYVCRKGYHSINTQIICNHEHLILGVNARYCGSTHDSFIWGSSRVLAMFENEYTSPQDQKFWILGDAGYPLQPWLMTAFSRETNEREPVFNRRHKKMRSRVERTIGLLTNRFRCIMGERKLRYKPEVCGEIINAVVVLHNFIVINKYEDEFSIFTTTPEPEPTLTGENVRVNAVNVYLADGKLVRERIVQSI